MNDAVLWITGPTAVGKSAVALEVARRWEAEIVSADSMQVYRGLDIGTAKPSAAERALVRHHLVDVCGPDEVFDVKRFVELAQQAMAEIRQRGKRVLIVGGTGLYVRALRQGLFEGPPRDDGLRCRLEAMPASELFEELRRVDPITAESIDRHNPRRLVRALEVFYATGRPIRSMQTQWESGDGRERLARVFCLSRERGDLVARIEARIEAQLAAGWLEEARRLREAGLASNTTAMQAAGYRELMAYWEGRLDWTQTVARIKARTRQLARRQMTWFRRERDLVWIEMERAESPVRTADTVCRRWREWNKI